MKIIENLSRFTILTNPNNLYCFNDSFKVKDTYYDVLIINGTFTKQELENLTPNDSTKSKIFHIKKETVNYRQQKGAAKVYFLSLFIEPGQWKPFTGKLFKD